MILLVEDDAISRTALAETLRNAGHEVLEAVTGVGALALLDQNPVKLIVLDFVLPDFGRTEVLGSHWNSTPEDTLAAALGEHNGPKQPATRRIGILEEVSQKDRCSLP